MYCAACDSPHHTDCFEYIGHCALYGCGQARYRRQPRGPVQALAPWTGGSLVRVATFSRPKGLATRLVAAGFSMIVLGIVVLTHVGMLWPVIQAYPVLAAVWALAGLSMLSLGGLIHLADGSHVLYDPAIDALVEVERAGGIELRRRRFPASDVDRVELHEPEGAGGGPVWLTVVLRSGERLRMARDGMWLGRGYDEADLVRMGNRVAGALQVPFTHHAPLPPGEKGTLE